MEKSIYASEYAVFLKRLRAAREEAGLTQEVVAEKLGATQTFVSKCERGERRMDIVELKSWCDALGISLSTFVERYEVALNGSS